MSWRLEADRTGVRQLGYELEVALDPEFAVIEASSGWTGATSPVAAPWPALPLASRQVRWVRVRICTDVGITAWSTALRVEAALLAADDWVARPISPAGNVDQAAPGPVPLVRRTFVLDRSVASARLYVTALGIHQSWLNGLPIGNAFLEPGWTAYQERLLYAAYDVTAQLRPGENVFAAAVADGWWRGWLTWMDKRAVYGTTTALLAQLEIRFDDGSEMTVATDESWRGGSGELLEADLYNGSVRDLRQEPTGWRLPDFDDRAWEGVECLPMPAGLELRPMPPVRIVESWAVAPKPTDERSLLVDTGQNLAGFLRLRVRGTRDAVIRVRHAEVLDNEGRLHTAPLRNARATDCYVLADDTPVTLEPAFTFHGFRYAEIEADADVFIDEVRVCVLSSDLRQIGEFRCSDERVNRLFGNVRWSQRGNFLALPTDCPQRDERLGWTGDIQVFAPTACMNADVLTFLASWLKDLKVEQREDGCVPSTVPNVISGFAFEYGGVGWGDAATLVPWALFEAYGDPTGLREQFNSMRAWVDWCASRRGPDGTWSGDFQLGDWLDPGAPSDQPHKATTNPNYIATVYLSFSAGVLAKAATVLGVASLAMRYGELSRQVAAAAWAHWREHALTTQAGCAMALEFEIAPPDEVPHVARRLAELVLDGDGRIGTGFLGTPLVLPALTSGGEIEAAYRLLLNEQCPGWLYQVVRGATTMWERWDAVREDGSLHPGDMAAGEGASMISFNHYAYGAVAAWLYRSVAGIAPVWQQPGYGNILFAPKPGGGLTHAEARISTPYGFTAIKWAIGDEGVIDVDLEVPPGALGWFEPPPSWCVMEGGTQRPNDRHSEGKQQLGSGCHRLRLAKSSRMISSTLVEPD